MRRDPAAIHAATPSHATSWPPGRSASIVRHALFGAAIVVASASLTGSATADDDDHDHGAHRRFAWLANDPGNTYDAATLAGIRDVAGAHATVDPFYAGFDPATQLAQCYSALATHRYDGLFIEAASATGIEPCVARARRAGIPVVATDLPIGPDATTVSPQVPGEVGACFLTAPEFSNSIAGILAEACQGLGACNVLYVAGDETFVFDQDGILAVEQVAVSTPSVHLIDHVQALYDTPTARVVVHDAVVAHPQINLVLAAGDQMALGAEQAATDLGVTLRILGGGAGASALAAVKAGRWYGTFNALPRTEGHLGGGLMLRALRDDDAAPQGIDPIAASGLPLWWTAASLAQHPSFVAEWPGP